MNFRRKTKALTGIPVGIYIILTILVVSFFWANSRFTHPKANIPNAGIDSLVVTTLAEEPEIDSLSKPEIYVPDVAVQPIDSVVITPSFKEEALIKKEDENLSNPKKEDLKTKKEQDKNPKEPKKTKIGTERKLIAFIPGTMGKAGKLPTNNCKARGELSMYITVDESGNVTSAGRNKGISDPCAVTAAVIWLKKYVKAEKKNNETSTGTYSIKF
ncbi:hypothetical protein ACK2M7_01670 [Chryseobacterium sp. TY4]